MRKCPNRLGKLASAILVTIAGRCFHYNDRQARDAGTATIAGDPTVEAGSGCVTRQHSIQVQRVPADVDARRADAGAAGEAGAELLGGLWRRCCDARTEPGGLPSGGSGLGREPGGRHGGRLRYRTTLRRADLHSRAIPSRIDVHAAVCRRRRAGRIAAGHRTGKGRHLAILAHFRFESGASAPAAIPTPRFVSARLPFHYRFC